MSNNVSGAEFEEVIPAGVCVCVDSIAQLELYAARLGALSLPLSLAAPGPGPEANGAATSEGGQWSDRRGAHEVYLRVNPGLGAGHHEKVITAGKACSTVLLYVLVISYCTYGSYIDYKYHRV